MDKYSLFNERKAAQAAAYLLCKAGGSLNVLKLVKLMYLAERESLRRYGETITGDALVSMRNGPVLSATLDHINGLVPSCQDGWDSLIDDRENHVVQLRNRDAIADPDEDLLALSECDAECLAIVWDRFGHMSKWQLVDYTHSPECPEWEDPGSGQRPIPPARVLRALGYGPEQVHEMTKRLREQQYLKAALSS